MNLAIAHTVQVRVLNAIALNTMEIIMSMDMNMASTNTAFKKAGIQ